MDTYQTYISDRTTSLYAPTQGRSDQSEPENSDAADLAARYRKAYENYSTPKMEGPQLANSNYKLKPGGIELDVSVDRYNEVDPHGKPLNSPGAKADFGKQRPWLVLGSFSRALSAVADVGTFGANKYTANGWVTVPNGNERYMDAAIRHLLKLGAGEVVDTGAGGSDCYHKAQVIWNLLASLELELRSGDLPPAAGHGTSDTK